jgi:secreted PhoX family phosphatase
MPALFYEGEDAAGIVPGSDAGRDYARLESPDNITVTPWGDVLVAEEGGGVNRLIGFTPEGESYVFALHSIPFPTLEEEGLSENFLSEVAGPTFSPDGQTLYFNVQSPGVTFAGWGPFKSLSASRQRQMSMAAPVGAFSPFISDDLRVAAERYGLSPLQAAAFHRLGVPVL